MVVATSVGAAGGGERGCEGLSHHLATSLPPPSSQPTPLPYIRWVHNTKCAKTHGTVHFERENFTVCQFHLYQEIR